MLHPANCHEHRDSLTA